MNALLKLIKTQLSIGSVMVKFLLKLLMVAFLMQSLWASAAQYCQHETGVNVHHFGHHTHQHKTGDAAQADQLSIKADDKSKTATHTDCPYCHAAVAKYLSSTPVILSNTPDRPPAIFIAITYPKIVLAQPERPNWLFAV